MKKSIFQKVGTILLGMALAFTPMLFSCSDGSDDSPTTEIPGNDKPGIENPETPELPGEIETPDVSGDVPNIGITNPDIEMPAGSDVFPVNGATNVYEDTTLYIKAPRATITRGTDKVVKIYEDNTLVATIDSKDATIYAFGMSGNIKQIKVNKQMISVQGDYVAIKIPSDSDAKSSVLKYGKTYSVEVSDGLISGYTPVEKDNWKFTVRAKPTINVSNITVGKNKDFKSLQGAFNYLMTEGTTGDVTINVDAGQYNERLTYKGDANVTIIGQGTGKYGADTIFYWANMNGPTQNNAPIADTNGEWWNADTRDRAMFLWQGGNLKLKNVGFKNTSADYSGGIITQAEAIYFDCKKELVAYNSSFYSYQDTVLVGANGGKCWFYECYIEGSVDYMWGTADVALFEKCLIHSKGYNDAATGSYLFASRTVYAETKISKGFVLLDSDVLIGNGVTQYYGRSPAAGHETQATVINCRFSNEGTGTLSDKLWLSPGFNYVDVRGIGAVAYKDYGNYLNGSLVSGDNRLDKTYGLDGFIANREYNGREAIFNRYYSVKNEKYEFDTTKFDADFYAAELGFTPATDASKNNLFIEPMFTDNLVGGSTVDYTVVDIDGNDATVSWTTGDESIATVANGTATAVAGVDGKTVSIGAVSGNKSGLAYIKVISENIKAEKVSLTAESSTLNLYGTTTLNVAATDNSGRPATNKEITFTSSDNKIKFYDDGQLKNSVTTTASTIKILAEKSGSFDITATSADGPNKSVTITVSDLVAEWTPAAAVMKVKEDVQNGPIVAFNGMIIDTATNGTEAKGKAKMSLSNDTRMQTYGVILYIPIDRDTTITVDYSSGLADGAGIKTGATTSNDKTSQTFEAKYASAVDGSTLSSLNITKGDGSVSALAKKYAKIEFGNKNSSGSTVSAYITKITRTYEEGSTSQEGNEPVVEGLEGPCNIYAFVHADSNATSDDDGNVTWTGFTDNNSGWTGTSATSTLAVKVKGSCEVILYTYQGKTNGQNLTVMAGETEILNGVFAGADGQNIKFIYKETEATTLNFTFGGQVYLNKVTVNYGTFTNGVESVTISGGSSTLSKGSEMQLSATAAVKYVNPTPAVDTSVTWAVTAGNSAASIDQTGKVTASDSVTEDTDVTVTATAGGVSKAFPFTVTAQEATQEDVLWDFATTKSSSTNVTYYTAYNDTEKTEATDNLNGSGFIKGSSSKILAEVVEGQFYVASNGAYFKNAKIKIPVSAGSVLTVVSTWGTDLNVGGTTIPSGALTCSCTASKAGYIELEGTGNYYFAAIKVTNVKYDDDHSTAVDVTEFTSTDTQETVLTLN